MEVMTRPWLDSSRPPERQCFVAVSPKSLEANYARCSSSSYVELGLARSHS